MNVACRILSVPDELVCAFQDDYDWRGRSQAAKAPEMGQVVHDLNKSHRDGKSHYVGKMAYSALLVMILKEAPGRIPSPAVDRVVRLRVDR